MKKQYEALDLNGGFEVEDKELTEEERAQDGMEFPDLEDEEEDSAPVAVSAVHPEPSPSAVVNGVRSPPSAVPVVADVPHEPPASQQAQREALPDIGRPVANGATLGTVKELAADLSTADLEDLFDWLIDHYDNRRRNEDTDEDGKHYAGWVKSSNRDHFTIRRGEGNPLRNLGLWSIMLSLANGKRKIKFETTASLIAKLYGATRATIEQGWNELEQLGLLRVSKAAVDTRTGKYGPRTVKLHPSVSPVASIRKSGDKSQQELVKYRLKQGKNHARNQAR